ncbi:hypothetical protein [Niabella aquatica]
MNSVFVVSKPLQYFNTTNIDDSNSKILLIIDGFKEASTFFIQVQKKSNYWDEVLFFANSSKAFDWLFQNRNIIQTLYLDGDYSLSVLKVLRKLKNVDIYVYEEGVGTYENNLKMTTTRNLVKNFTLFTRLKVYAFIFLYKLIGLKNFQGGNKFTKGIIVYNVERHKICVPEFRKKRKTFKVPFVEHLSTCVDRDILYTMNINLLDKVRGRKVLLYLTSWTINPAISKVLDKHLGYISIAKPHPHIKGEKRKKLEELGFNYISEGRDLVEFLLNDILLRCEELLVVHENTSALAYFKNNPKLRQQII